ncbi:unnamed protein product [Dicrocoelium dendriticum]|nr:unnamed protein product [Dicrocoelium dendriticum]
MLLFNALITYYCYPDGFCRTHSVHLPLHYPHDLSDDLDQLDTSISETGHRWRCMREAIDILKTLGDCQVKADSSNCFDECSVVLLEHDNVEEQPPSDIVTAAALNSGFETAMTDSEDVPMSVDEPTTPHYSTCLGPQIIYADENQSNDRVASFYLGDYKSKIPKPNLPAVRALGPSFLLMNPPANLQREGNSFSTPQHISSENSKQPTSMPSRLRRPKGGIPVASLTRPEGIFPSAAPWS